MKSIPLHIIFWYIFPIVLLFASNFIVTALSLDSRFKIKSVDFATPFLLIGLNKLSKDIYKESIVPYVIITILLFGIVIAILHAYRYGNIQYQRYFKMYWRVIFLLTVIMYAAMVILNVISYV